MQTKKPITIFINDKKYTAWEGQRILDVCREKDIQIPSLCFHPDIEPQAGCRLCLVQIEGREGLDTACTNTVYDGIQIKTDTEEIRRARKINLELIFAQHEEKCGDCFFENDCQLLQLAKEYELDVSRFFDRKQKNKNFQISQAIKFDASKCIDCGNCVEICKQQGANHLELTLQDKENNFYQVYKTSDPKKECIHCGQCINHCPAGAFSGVFDYEKILDILEDNKKTVVFQLSPSVTFSISQELELDGKEDISPQIIAAIRKLGANKIFNTSVGTDLSIIEQAKEVLDKIKDPNKLPIISSNCPSVVEIVNSKYPELKPHLSRVRSPHVILGGLINTYWAKKEEVNADEVIVISVSPCTAAKHEIQKEELPLRGLGLNFPTVDYVISPKELLFLLKKQKVDIKKQKQDKFDNLLGKASSNGLMFEQAGGLANSVLSVAYEMGNSKKAPPFDFQASKFQNVNITSTIIKDKEFHAGYLEGAGNIKDFVEEIERNREIIDYLEVMACPGACLGGGGQALPTNKSIINKRKILLENFASRNKIKKAYDSPIVNDIYENFFEDESMLRALCFQKFDNN